MTELQRARATATFQAAFTRPEPLVTVCVATTNRAEVLVHRCLASLLAQTYTNVQIVVVGEQCVDDTPTRVAALRDDRVVFVNLPSRGPYPRAAPDRWRVAGTHAMNCALELAEGDFVCHLDDDDQAVATRVERLVATARATRAELLWHRFWWECEDGGWQIWGSPSLACGEVTTGSIFYHRYFTAVGWDVHAYRVAEPGDWNRVRRITALEPHTAFVPEALTVHYREGSQREYVALAGETFLD